MAKPCWSRPTFATSRYDAYNAGFDVIQHFVGWQAYGSKASLGHDAIPGDIFTRLIPAIVRFAIDFDHQPSFQTGKIQRVRLLWNLFAEFVASGAFLQFDP